MSITDIMSQKSTAREELKTRYSFPKRSKILIWVYFSDKKLYKNIVSGFSILPANFIIFWKNESEVEAKNINYEADHESFDMHWIDAIICDCKDLKLESLMEVWVVPLVNENNYLWKIIQEFHPGRAEGNAYLYEKGSYWSAYYALIRYLENHKFPYDNRNLVKNVVWM